MALTGPLRLLHGNLRDHRPDHPQHGGGHQEVQQHHQHGAQLPVDRLRRGDQVPHLGVHPEATEHQQRPQGQQRPDRPPRLHPVRQPAPQDVAQADPAQDHPDDTGPHRQRCPHVTGHQAAGDQFQDHDAKTAEERQGIRHQTGSEADHTRKTPCDRQSGLGVCSIPAWRNGGSRLMPSQYPSRTRGHNRLVSRFSGTAPQCSLPPAPTRNT